MPHTSAMNKQPATGDNLPLSGVRVLDLSRVLAGPWASQALGDLGAEVIKIENPDGGDDTRSWGPPFLEDGETAAYYLSCNRNKKSVTIDISKPEGAAIIREIAACSDIVIENFKVGGLAKYGLDHASLRQVNAGLVYCSITGFGQTGPYASRPGYDFLIQGMSGLMSITGQPEGAPGYEPMKVGVAVSDIIAGLYATIAILAALRHRERTGVGQQIDCALLDTQVSVLANQAMNWLVGGILPKPLGNKHPNVVPYRTFPTKDGHVIVAVGNDGQFRLLCKMLDRPDLAGAPCYAENAGRLANREALEAGLAESIATWTSHDMITAMTSAGVPGGPINRIDEVFEDPQIKARGLVGQLETPAGTTVPTIEFPVRFSATPASCRLPPPALGEHTDAVLMELLALSSSQVDALRQAGVIA